MIVHEDWLLTSHRAAVHLPTATAVIADLHLGYDQARRKLGEAVPSVGAKDALAQLKGLVDQHAPRRLIIAGDWFEAGHSAAALRDFLEGLRALGLELTALVPGNHDRHWPKELEPINLAPDGFQLGEWLVLHGDKMTRRGRVVHGHWHPCLRLRGGLAAPCYLVGPRQIVLPAFTAEAAGANVLRQRRWGRYRCCAIAGEKILDFGEVAALKKAHG